ncbi:uncharacterized protein LOC100366375 [Saccoglossus kowalevskii]|uniref:Uncharacterized protein LOC100366375 n=1 Tax=Saccoglossus kowalevskii TaxID=10224 RepID=A0ABM0GWY6_SACKO|nr:PREDICTED: uncharacterized protein LOC100366375 [Saccoglossus kowalevskii]
MGRDLDESHVVPSNSSINRNTSNADINILEGPGTMYVRWGRSSCPTSAELVYQGVIGGEYYTNSGGGSNYQCLPLDPIWDQPSSGKCDACAKMWGSEYQSDLYPPFSHLFQHDSVCAVCLVNSRSRVLMVPARNQCPSIEWTREYYGYLMAENFNHQRSEFICVDRYAEVRPGSVDNDNGALLYNVEARCGSLPCGPYIDGYELTCAVCTI